LVVVSPRGEPEFWERSRPDACDWMRVAGRLGDSSSEATVRRLRADPLACDSVGALMVATGRPDGRHVAALGVLQIPGRKSRTRSAISSP
jgi:hypothetical protein